MFSDDSFRCWRCSYPVMVPGIHLVLLLFVLSLCFIGGSCRQASQPSEYYKHIFNNDIM